jgi:superfamily II DNA/RNA helicase
MDSDHLSIEKNFDYGQINSYDDLPLKPSVKSCIKEEKIEIPLIHSHILPAILNINDILLSSPAATGKSSLISIALHQVISERNQNLQILIVEQLEHLVRETYDNLHHFSMNSNINYFLGDKSSTLKADFRPFAHCQVAIVSCRKCFLLLSHSRRSYSTVKFVILDALDPSYEKSLNVLNLLKEKIPHATYWVTTRIREEEHEKLNFFKNYLKNPCVLLVKKNHFDVRNLSHSFTVVQNFEEKIFYLKKILSMNKECQKIVFFGKNTNFKRILNDIESFSPVLLHEEQQQGIILRNFYKKMFKVLVVDGKQFFSRKIKSSGYLYVVIFDVPELDVYETLSRRGGCKTDDRVYTFVQGNDEAERIEEISRKYRIRISRWPNDND